MQRQATALHLAGDYAESDQVCAAFQQKFPKSPLLPDVLFRSRRERLLHRPGRGEEPEPAQPRSGAGQAERRGASSAISVVVEKYPEFAARQPGPLRRGHGHCTARASWTRRRRCSRRFPPPTATATWPWCRTCWPTACMRTAPAKADDALAAGKLQEQLKEAVELLDAFIGGQPNSPETPDALIKLGFCHQRLAALLAEPAGKGTGRWPPPGPPTRS